MNQTAKIPPSEWKKVNLARVTYDAYGGAACSCGWSKRPCRVKVLENAIDRHLDRRHAGKGVRL